MPGGPVLDEEGLAVQSTGGDELLGRDLERWESGTKTRSISTRSHSDLDLTSSLALRLAKET